MESLTLPTTAAQAKAFVSPSSLSFPMSHADQTSDLALPTSSSSTGAGMNGTAAAAAAPTTNGATTMTNGNVPDKDAVTTGGVSGIVPTLQ
jgi:transcription initiation factor TFIID TATA-box-binding protein